MKQKTLLGAGGLLSLLIIWQLSSYWLSQRISLASTLAPLPTLDSFIWLISSGEIFPHLFASLQRIFVGLSFYRRTCRFIARLLPKTRNVVHARVSTATNDLPTFLDANYRDATRCRRLANLFSTRLRFRLVADHLHQCRREKHRSAMAFTCPLTLCL